MVAKSGVVQVAAFFAKTHITICSNGVYFITRAASHVKISPLLHSLVGRFGVGGGVGLGSTRIEKTAPATDSPNYR
jgi:hypothetical protein